MKRPFTWKGKVGWLTREGGDWMIILFSLLLAFFIWFVHNLSLDYNVHFRYLVQIRTTIPGRSPVSEEARPMLVRGKASGYYIIKHRLGLENRLELALDERLLHRDTLARDRFTVYGAEIRNQFSEAVSPDVQLDYVVTDEAVFEIPEILHKKVPVVAKTDLTFRDQYMPVGKLTLQPDSVYIYGKERFLNRVDSVFTENIAIRQLDENLQLMVGLMPMRGITPDRKEVYVSLDVLRYVEHTVELPVRVVNLPPDRVAYLIPATVRLTYRQTYPILEPGKDGSLELTVDYRDLVESVGMQAVPRLKTNLPGVQPQYELDPPYVEGVFLN